MIVFPNEMTRVGVEYEGEVLANKFLEDLVKHIEAIQDDRIPSRSLKPSSLQCNRQAWYYINTPPSEPEERKHALIGITETGTFRHEALQAYIETMGEGWEYIDVAEYIMDNPHIEKLKDLKVVRKVGAETLLRNEKYNMNFMCDGILKYDNKYYILEIKTESTWKFKYNNYVNTAHFNQARAYSFMFGIPDVIFLYENRDFNEKKAYMFTSSEEDLKKFEDMINNILTSQEPPELTEEFMLEVDDNVKPGRISAKARREGYWQDQHKPCEYCPFRESCKAWENREKLVELELERKK